MHLTNLIDVLRRRVVPLIIIALLGAGLALTAWLTTPVRHNATAVVVVLPAPEPGAPAKSNPLTRLNYDAVETSNLTLSLMNSPAVQAALARSGASLTSADNAVDPKSPAIGRSTRVTFGVESDTPQGALDGAQTVIQVTQDQLNDFQAELGVVKAQRATLQPLVAPYATTSDRTDRLRAAAGSLLGTLVLGTVAVLAWDLLTSRRRDPATYGWRLETKD